MRNITDHRFEDGGFDETIRSVVKNSPWWMTSLVVHVVAAFILWQIPVATKRTSRAPTIQSELAAKPDEPVEDENVEPLPKIDPKEVDLPPTEDEDEVKSDDSDSPFDEPEGLEGDESGPLTGPSKNTSIGLGPGAGGGRGRGSKGKRRPGGDSDQTEGAVELGLKWLADHQDVDEDGKWDADEFMKHDSADDRCDGAGGQLYDTGVTGLALLAFLGAGYTDRGSRRENRFAQNVRMGLRYLMASQTEDGVFGTKATHNFIYNHSIATLAMCEAYWMTRNPRYKKPAQEGLNFLAMARNPYLAWRYVPRGGMNDTSVTGWCVMALKSGKFAGLEVDPDAFEGARQWIDKMTDPNFGNVGYDFPGGGPARPEGKQDRFPQDKTESMTAVGILTRIFLGEDPKSSKLIRLGAKLCAEKPPVWNPDDGSIDMYYWYYATLGLFQVGGKDWRKWNEAMKKAIVGNQHRKGSGRKIGSWDPIGAWGDDGGRVYSTACMVMCLEVYYRYDRVFGARSE
ncbi:MAG: terpene cyclase/mutase family protein [Planctomycetota bacterium]|nr:terpene cyclase/mutase family protein [Planctomycetota bacterium]